MRLGPAAWILALALAAAPAQGQDAATGTDQGGQSASPAPAKPDQAPAAGSAGAADVAIPSAVLTIDPDRLFSASEYGKRVQQELEGEARALAAENHRIEAELSAEELDLTQKRPTLAPDEFRKLADAFDAKVKGIRKAQDEKNKAIADRREAEREQFLQLVLPILGGLMRENGAVAILNQQAIFLSFRGIDITDRAVARIDEKIGDGAALDKLDGGTAPDTGQGGAADKAPPGGPDPGSDAGTPGQ